MIADTVFIFLALFRMIDCPVHFAPLQGYTDAPYRNFFHRFFGGVDTYYTPFIRMEKGMEFRKKELRDVEPSENSVPGLIPQAIASVPEELRKIVQMLSDKGYNHINLNLGCPFPLLAGRHKGSGILPFPDEVRDLLETLKEFPGISYSVKMRLGWNDPDEALRLLPLFEKFPVSRIILHPRLGVQQYKGTVDMNAFTRFYEACPIPLIYNGDLKTTAEIETVLTGYPRLSGIMIGRGLLADPALALACKSGKKLPDDEYRDRLLQFHNALLQHYSSHYQGGDHQVLTKMKTLWEYLCPDADKKLRKRILKSNKLDVYQCAVQEIFRG